MPLTPSDPPPPSAGCVDKLSASNHAPVLKYFRCSKDHGLELCKPYQSRTRDRVRAANVSI